jgi:hypothetical protein
MQQLSGILHVLFPDSTNDGNGLLYGMPRLHIEQHIATELSFALTSVNECMSIRIRPTSSSGSSGSTS